MGRVGTWEEVSAHLERTRPGARVVAGQHIQVPVSVRRERDGDATSTWTIDVRRLDDPLARVAISGTAGNARYLPPLEVLHLNFLVAIGSICLYRGTCVLRQTLPLAGLHLRDLDEVIDAVADQCEAIKRRLAEG